MQSIQNGITETILQPIPIDQLKNNPMSEIQQISSPQKITQEQTPSSIKHDAVQNLQQQKQSSISIFDKKTMEDNLNKALDTVDPNNTPINKQESLHIGDSQQAQTLGKVLETPSHQPTENAPQISLETPKTEGTTITKEISSRHPHLDEATNEAVQAYFNPEKKEVKTQDVENLISYLKDENIIDQKGKINFEKLGLDKKTIKKAGIKGEIFIKDGAFDFKISGKCSVEAQECLKALKNKLEALKEANNLDIPININPASVGPLSAEDQAALANGGQIQYRTLPNGDVMKLTLDPGSNGDGDGLTIGVYKPGSDYPLEQKSLSAKIPLKLVFEGAELNGKKVGPFLPHWREEKLFEKSVIHTETGLLGKEKKTNKDDVGRIQDQNKLWNAAFEYLKASVEITDGHFDASNGTDVSDTTNTQQANPESGVTLDSSQQIYTMENQQQAAELNDVNEDSKDVMNPPDELKQLEESLSEIETTIKDLKDAGFEGIEKFELEYREIKRTIKAYAKTPKKYVKQLLKNAQKLVEEINKITKDQGTSATDVAPLFKFENGESTIKNAGVKAKVRAPQKKRERDGNLLDAAKKMADYMQNIVSALPEDDSQEMQTAKMVESPKMKINIEETQEQYAVIGDTTKENP